MSVAEMKKKINEKVDTLNEAQLKVVMGLIEKVESAKDKSTANIELIFEEAAAKYGMYYKSWLNDPKQKSKAL